MLYCSCKYSIFYLFSKKIIPEIKLKPYFPGIFELKIGLLKIAYSIKALKTVHLRNLKGFCYNRKIELKILLIPNPKLIKLIMIIKIIFVLFIKG